MKLFPFAAAALVSCVRGGVDIDVDSDSVRGLRSNDRLSKVVEKVRTELERAELLQRRELNDGEDDTDHQTSCDCSKAAKLEILTTYKDVLEHIPLETLGALDENSDAISDSLGGLPYDPSIEFIELVSTLEALVNKSTATLDLMHCGPCDIPDDESEPSDTDGGESSAVRLGDDEPESPTSSAPTSEPTSAPTSTPTSVPTSAPTSAPTDTPTTSAPTSTPTSAPTSAPAASIASLPPSCEVEFILYDADADVALRPLNDDECVLPNTFSIEARPTTACGAALSVNIKLTGPVHQDRTESSAPFMIFGDNGSGDVYGTDYKTGSYTISASVYVKQGHLRGDLLLEREFDFTVRDCRRRRLAGAADRCEGISHFECCCDVELIKDLTTTQLYALAEIANLNPGASSFIEISRDAIQRTTTSIIMSIAQPYLECSGDNSTFGADTVTPLTKETTPVCPCFTTAHLDIINSMAQFQRCQNFPGTRTLVDFDATVDVDEDGMAFCVGRNCAKNCVVNGKGDCVNEILGEPKCYVGGAHLGRPYPYQWNEGTIIMDITEVQEESCCRIVEEFCERMGDPFDK